MWSNMALLCILNFHSIVWDAKSSAWKIGQLHSHKKLLQKSFKKTLSIWKYDSQRLFMPTDTWHPRTVLNNPPIHRERFIHGKENIVLGGLTPGDGGWVGVGSYAGDPTYFEWSIIPMNPNRTLQSSISVIQYYVKRIQHFACVWSWLFPKGTNCTSPEIWNKICCQFY